MDNIRSEIQKYEDSKGYLETSFGTLKPIESNADLFSSNDERDYIMMQIVNYLRSTKNKQKL